jgi:hypothetical protein
MRPITLNNPQEIMEVLGQIALKGKGFTTNCLLDDVLEAGFTEPIYFNGTGEDPDAYYQGQPNAWAVYQIREWKRVLMIYGGGDKARRYQITETP